MLKMIAKWQKHFAFRGIPSAMSREEKTKNQKKQKKKKKKKRAIKTIDF